MENVAEVKAELEEERIAKSLRSKLIRNITCAIFLITVFLLFVYIIHEHVSPFFLFSLPFLYLALFCIVRAIVIRETSNLEAFVIKTDEYIEGDLQVEFPEATCEEVEHLSRNFTLIRKENYDAYAEVRAEDSRRGQFISDVSHEMRTPLTAIRGNAETLLDPDVPEDLRISFLNTIISECDRLTRLANDLITLQRIESTSSDIPLERINLRPIAEDVASMLEPIFDERGVTCTIIGEAPDIMGDSDRLHQVFINLMANASRYAKDNGEIRVTLAGLGGQSVIAVSDDGPGFGDIDPARLFDRFYRADQSRVRSNGGSGLGLSIVKSVATSLGGTVEAFNKPHSGACFIVAIPVAKVDF